MTDPHRTLPVLSPMPARETASSAAILTNAPAPAVAPASLLEAPAMASGTAAPEASPLPKVSPLAEASPPLKEEVLPVPAPRLRPDPTRYGDWELNGKCVDF